MRLPIQMGSVRGVDGLGTPCHPRDFDAIKYASRRRSLARSYFVLSRAEESGRE